MTAPIPFNRPVLTGRELELMAQAIENGQISGGGSFTRRCEELLESLLGAPRVILTTSCTHALEMSAILLRLEPGDEVILPSFTFVSTANAFVLRGAVPVFADIRADTLNLDESLLEPLITSRTRAIVPVHYAGVACEMNRISQLAAERNVAVVEDNAHGLFARYGGKPLGTFGSLATQSFHETKNIHCGEGGALIINDRRLVERAEIIRDKGTNRSRFFRGEVDRYSWVDTGSSYALSDLLAAFLLAQLEDRERIQARRRQIWETYWHSLSGWASKNGVVLPTVPPACEPSHHLFYLLLPSLESRQALITHMKNRRILAVFHYVPLHLSEAGRSLGGRPGACPVTESVSDRLVRLPFYNSLSAEDQDRVIDAVLEFRL